MKPMLEDAARETAQTMEQIAVDTKVAEETKGKFGERDARDSFIHSISFIHSEEEMSTKYKTDTCFSFISFIRV